MTATKAKPPKTETLKAFKVTLDSPLVPRIAVTIQATDHDDAKRIVLGWINDGMKIEVLNV